MELLAPGFTGRELALLGAFDGFREAEDYRLELYDTLTANRYGKSVLAYRFFHSVLLGW